MERVAFSVRMFSSVCGKMLFNNSETHSHAEKVVFNNSFASLAALTYVASSHTSGRRLFSDPCRRSTPAPSCVSQRSKSQTRPLIGWWRAPSRALWWSSALGTRRRGTGCRASETLSPRSTSTCTLVESGCFQNPSTEPSYIKSHNFFGLFFQPKEELLVGRHC